MFENCLHSIPDIYKMESISNRIAKIVGTPISIESITPLVILLVDIYLETCRSLKTDHTPLHPSQKIIFLNKGFIVIKKLLSA
jgi:hypothetical protein